MKKQKNHGTFFARPARRYSCAASQAASWSPAWPEIRDQLLRGTYRPSPVRRGLILKPDGGERKLGIPTVTDRLIQQTLLQVLQFDRNSLWDGANIGRVRL